MADYTKRPTGSTPGAGVDLGKVTLTKAAPTLSLTKAGAATGQLRVNLNWNARPAAAQGGGFLKRLAASAQPGIDLDLGCLYELADGSKGVVQALGNALTSQNEGAPIISLDGDDRAGTNTEGENLRIELSRSAELRRVLVFAFIYQGAPNWAEADGVVTLHPASGPPIEVRLDEPDPGAMMCAIALLESTGSDLSVRREVRYIHGGHDVLDRTYDWGLQWAPGRK